MSLLNQVLRDLDQRQAPSAPAAVKAASPRSLAPTAAQRAKRWGLGAAATLAAVVAGGWAQGSIRWPAAETGTPVAAATVVPTPVMPVAPAAAPVAVAATMAVTPATPVATAPVAAPVTPSAAPAPVATNEPVALQVAIAAPTSRAKPVLAAPVSATAATVAPKNEARIEVRPTARSSLERAEAQYQRGVTAHQAGQINDSATAFTAALREDPRHAGARVAQAGLLIEQARGDEAMALLKEGIALAPAQPQVALMLARMQAERQDWLTAAETLKGASAQAGSDAEFQGLHAAILQRAGRHGDAVEKYGLALRLAPNRSVWWMGLAISLEEIGQADTARAAFQRAKSIGLPEGAAGYVDARLRQLG